MAYAPRGVKHERALSKAPPAFAKIAGTALASVPGATAVDSIIMASAAQRGDAVFTSDIDDLDRLRAHFPGVRLFRV